MIDLTDSIMSSLAQQTSQTMSDLTTLMGAHPFMLFVGFSLASIFVLNRSGSAN